MFLLYKNILHTKQNYFEKGGEVNLSPNDNSIVKETLYNFFKDYDKMHDFIKQTGLFDDLDDINRVVALCKFAELKESDLYELHYDKNKPYEFVLKDGKIYYVFNENEVEILKKPLLELQVDIAMKSIPEHLTFYFDEDKYKNDVLLLNSDIVETLTFSYKKYQINKKLYYACEPYDIFVESLDKVVKQF
ncbi:MAG: hypothetical protein KatS3mg096_638 [Candidatus Parcubacteria bacterium]|nr:MAG: hypothetical protein KatS3mg096_638 [Candidatus Parcubacteria bacterium]